jgi:glycosyltransferase involved in cell wall biosynthesis
MNAFLTAYLGGTHGTAKSARDFLRAMLAYDESVFVVSPETETFPSEVAGFKLSQPLWFTNSSHYKFPRRPNRLFFRRVKEWFNNRRLISEQAANFKNTSRVFVNGWASCQYWMEHQHRFNCKKVIVVRESIRHFEFGDRSITLSNLINTFAEFDELIFVSEKVKSEWLENSKLKDKPSYVLPNCCEEEEASQVIKFDRPLIRRSFGFDDDDFIVICPGAIELRKGQDILAEILPDLVLKIPKIKVIFIGGAETDWGRRFCQNVTESSVSKNVCFWNYRPSILDALFASDVLAFPSRAEAMPRTILESMAVMTPIVSSNVDGIPELITDRETGILFEVDDQEGLKNGIIKIYSEIETRKTLAASANKHYWDNFSRQHQFMRLASIIDKMSK